jgi:hypothetical protein
MAELVEEPAADDRADDSKNEVQQQAFAALIHDFAADETG